jgi:hypothetical protein
MNALIVLLAVVGVLAVSRRLLGSVFRLLGRGVDAFLAEEATTLTARRGDLTGLHEAESRGRAARRARLRAGLDLTLWVALLAVPPFTPWPALLYAAYAPLWLGHARLRS